MKREAIGHTKMKRLCRRMDIPVWQAVGLLESLWLTAGRETPRGDIGKLSDEDIALAIDFRGDETKMIEDLIACGWIDRHDTERLIIHDWFDHADDAVHMRLARTLQFFVDGKAPKITRLAGKEKDRAHNFYDSCAQNGTSSALPEPVTRASNQSQSQQPEPEPLAPRTNAPAAKPASAPITINQPRWKSDPDFATFRKTAEPAWGDLIDSDFEDCYHVWRTLDFEQKLACVNGIKARVEAKLDFQFVPRPHKFLKSCEYNRPIKARDSPKSAQKTTHNEALIAAQRIKDQQEKYST